MCQCTYLQERVSGWHCNITIVPKNILENCKCWLVFVSKFISSCNYRLYWKSAFALKLYVNQYFPCGVLSRSRRTERFIPQMVQQHQVWHCTVTLSDQNNNIKTYSTCSGDSERWLDSACVLFCFTVFAFGITSSGTVLDQRGSQKWRKFLLICEYNLCSLPCQSSQENRIASLVFKIPLSNTVSLNFDFLESTCQIYGRTSTATQDKPSSLYLVTQKVFICQVKQQDIICFPTSFQYLY